MGDSGLVRRSGAVVVAVAVAGLLTACGTKGAGGTAPPATSGSAEVKASDSFTSSTVGATENCTKVKVALGAVQTPENGQAQLKLPLTMTNTGPGPCVLRGFPGVRLQARDGDVWDIASVLITPPNTEDSQTFQWPGGPVLRQDAATRPGTYVGPVGVWGSGVS